MSDDQHEIVLTITIEAKDEEKTLFLVELQQAGIFEIAGYSGEELSAIIGSFCPNILFSVRARVDCIADPEGRVSGVRPAADQFRRAVHAGEAGTGGAGSRGGGEALIDERTSIAVIGAGSWGTALALQLARNDNEVRLGGVVELTCSRLWLANGKTCATCPVRSFPENLHAEPDLATCIGSTRDVLVVVPATACETR